MQQSVMCHGARSRHLIFEHYDCEKQSGACAAHVQVLLAFANFTLGIIVVQALLYIAPYNELAVIIVNAGYYAADTVIGLITFIFVFLFSIVPIVHSIQSLLLFNKDVLAKSRAGRQLKAFEQASGYAGQVALHGGAASPGHSPRKDGGGGGGAGGAGGAGGDVPVGAHGPIPAPAANPQAVLPPRISNINMTVGTSLAQDLIGGGAFHRSGGAARRLSRPSYGAPRRGTGSQRGPSDRSSDAGPAMQGSGVYSIAEEPEVQAMPHRQQGHGRPQYGDGQGRRRTGGSAQAQQQQYNAL